MFNSFWKPVSQGYSLIREKAESLGLGSELSQIEKKARGDKQDELGPDPFGTREKKYGSKSANIKPFGDNTIHYVWFGSTIPAKYQQNISVTKKSNPESRVIFWTENARIQPSIPGIELINIFDYFQGDDALKLETYIRYELARPQYAAASDMLRIELQSRFGGLYLDCDIALKEPFPYFEETFKKLTILTLFNNIYGMI
ncbi:MAG: TcdA/TcdB catalytic glycosyltransferase domain-containing protein [Legionella sp.]|jgi:hypothetical protein